jgi:transposase
VNLADSRHASTRSRNRGSAPRSAATASRAAGGDDIRRLLQRWVRSGTTPHRVVRRSTIVLLALEGLSSRAIARELGVSQRTVLRWRRRFERAGCEALWRDAPGRGRKPTVSPEVRLAVWTARASMPKATMRELARLFGISLATVHRILMRAAHD